MLLPPLQLSTPIGNLSLFTTITTFGTARDVTVQELVVELFFPADDATRALLTGTRTAGPDARPTEVPGSAAGR